MKLRNKVISCLLSIALAAGMTVPIFAAEPEAVSPTNVHAETDEAAEGGNWYDNYEATITGTEAKPVINVQSGLPAGEIINDQTNPELFEALQTLNNHEPGDVGALPFLGFRVDVPTGATAVTLTKNNVAVDGAEIYCGVIADNWQELSACGTDGKLPANAQNIVVYLPIIGESDFVGQESPDDTTYFILGNDIQRNFKLTFTVPEVDAAVETAADGDTTPEAPATTTEVVDLTVKLTHAAGTGTATQPMTPRPAKGPGFDKDGKPVVDYDYAATYAKFVKSFSNGVITLDTKAIADPKNADALKEIINGSKAYYGVAYTVPTGSYTHVYSSLAKEALVDGNGNSVSADLTVEKSYSVFDVMIKDGKTYVIQYFPIATVGEDGKWTANTDGKWTDIITWTNENAALAQKAVVSTAEYKVTPPYTPPTNNRPSGGSGSSSNNNTVAPTEGSGLTITGVPAEVSTNTPAGTAAAVEAGVTNITNPSLDAKPIPVNSAAAQEFVKAATGFAITQVLDINMFDSTTKITKVEGGKVQIALPFNAPDTSKEYVVLRFNDDKSVSVIPATLSNGKIVFKTDHFSRYAIAVKSDNANLFGAVSPTTTTDTTTSEVPKTGVELLAPLF